MSLFSATCAFALQFGDPCSDGAAAAPLIDPPSAMFAATAVSPDELRNIYGTGLPEAGTDQAAQAARVRRVDVAFEVQRTSDQTREVFDNWNVQVAAPLIAQATAASR